MIAAFAPMLEIVSKDGSIRTIPWRPIKTVPSRPTISLLKTPEKVTVFPDEYFEIEAPPEVAKYESSEILLLPRMHSKYFRTQTSYALKMLSNTNIVCF